MWWLSEDKQPSYKHFYTAGAFSHKLLIGSKKLGDANIVLLNSLDLLYHHAKYGGDRGSRAGCRRKM